MESTAERRKHSIRFGGSHDAVSSSLGHAATQLRLQDARGNETTTSPSDMATRDVQAPSGGLDPCSVRRAGGSVCAGSDRPNGGIRATTRNSCARVSSTRRPGVSLGSSPALPVSVPPARSNSANDGDGL
jgi:hypothetical protein